MTETTPQPIDSARTHAGTSRRASRPVRRWYAPPTVSRSALLVDGSDQTCRRLIYNLLTVAARMEECRDAVATRCGVSGPQYSILMAIARQQGENGVGATSIARLLHVTPAFIASETRKLMANGLVEKRRNPVDRRGVLLSVSATGRALVQRYAGTIRRMNDTLFGQQTAEEFRALATMVEVLVETSAETAAMLEEFGEKEPSAPRRSACRDKSRRRERRRAAIRPEP